MGELRGIAAGAVLMLSGIVAGFCLNEVARKGLPPIHLHRPKRRTAVVSTGPMVSSQPVQEDDGYVPLRPPDASTPPMSPSALQTPEPGLALDLQASRSFHAHQERLRMNRKYGDNVGMLMS